MKTALDLGGYYYGKKMYDLAYKYYSIAADADIPYAWMINKKPYIIPVPGFRKIERLK